MKTVSSLRHAPEERVFRAIVVYAVGSGRHGITMLAKDEEGIDRELRVSYFGLDQSWGQTKGIDFAPAIPETTLGLVWDERRLTTVCRVTRRGSVRSGQPPQGQKAPKARTMASAASAVTDPGRAIVRRRNLAFRRWQLRFGPRRRRESD